MVGRCARAVVFDGAVSTTPRSRQTRNSADTGLSHAPSLAGFACLMPSVAADLPRRGIRARVGRRVSSSAANDRGEAEVRGVERWLLQCRRSGREVGAAASGAGWLEGEVGGWVGAAPGWLIRARSSRLWPVSAVEGELLPRRSIERGPGGVRGAQLPASQGVIVHEILHMPSSRPAVGEDRGTRCGRRPLGRIAVRARRSVNRSREPVS